MSTNAPFHMPDNPGRELDCGERCAWNRWAPRCSFGEAPLSIDCLEEWGATMEAHIATLETVIEHCHEKDVVLFGIHRILKQLMQDHEALLNLTKTTWKCDPVVLEHFNGENTEVKDENEASAEGDKDQSEEAAENDDAPQ